jgi:hypothetical protein
MFYPLYLWIANLETNDSALNDSKHSLIMSQCSDNRTITFVMEGKGVSNHCQLVELNLLTAGLAHFTVTRYPYFLIRAA